MATKEDLKPRYAVTLDKAMESRIRQAVNNYANSIPHNPLTSLGDDISISTVSLRPMYTRAAGRLTSTTPIAAKPGTMCPTNRCGRSTSTPRHRR